MMEILRDPVWQFGGFMLTIVATFFSVFLNSSKDKKRLECSKITNSMLLSKYSQISEKIKIKLTEKNIKNIQILVIKFENTGTVDILPKDFERELNISIPNSKIFDSEIIAASPKNIK